LPEVPPVVAAPPVELLLESSFALQASREQATATNVTSSARVLDRLEIWFRGIIPFSDEYALTKGRRIRK
jgi:hypothetical protein